MTELHSLVEVALLRFGCHIQAEQANLLHVAIPGNSPMRQVLDVGDTVYLALVAMEEDRLAGLDPVRHLIDGSIYLERFIGILTEYGAVGDVMLPKVYARPADRYIRSVLSDSLLNADGYEMVEAGEITHRCVTFHFVIDLFAVESSKTLVSVTFDLDEGRLIDDLDIPKLLNAEPAAVEVAPEELQTAAQTVLESVRAKACRLIEAYGEKHGNERNAARKTLQLLAKEQLGTNDAGGEPVEDPSNDIARDWELRIRQADSQYRAEGAQITLVSATRQLRPFALYEIRFPPRVWRVLYDLNVGTHLLPVCHSCGSVAGKLTMGLGACAHPLCEHCAGLEPSCRHLTCRQCVRKCASCPVTMCEDCVLGCDHAGCSSGLCDKHKMLCPNCEASACAQHRRFCRACQRTFCTGCYHKHQWKLADCGHLLDCGPKPAACRVCKETLCSVCTDKCRRCGGYACNRHVAICSGCRLHVCERCAGMKCETCGTVSCKEHSFRCKVCTSHFCYEHAQRCGVCSRAVCDSHVVMCEWCGSGLCPKHGERGADDPPGCPVCEGDREAGLLFCDYCQERFPPDLLTQHDDSDHLICMDCRVKCTECDTWLPEFEFVQCAACAILLCSLCLDYHADMCPAF